MTEIIIVEIRKNKFRKFSSLLNFLPPGETPVSKSRSKLKFTIRPGKAEQ